jgi:hypothetical protein
MLEISNNDYKNTIDLLTAKLGIKEPMINRAEMYGNDHPLWVLTSTLEMHRWW